MLNLISTRNISTNSEYNSNESEEIPSEHEKNSPKTNKKALNSLNFNELIVDAVHEARNKLTRMKEKYKKIKESSNEKENSEIIQKARSNYSFCIKNAVKEEKMVYYNEYLLYVVIYK